MLTKTLMIGAMAASLLLATAAAAEVASPQAVGCKLIKTAAQLQAMQNDLAGSYCLANDIDAGSIANFVPVGDNATPFTGKLFGNGRVIRNLTIDSGAQYVGLFGAVADTLIEDIGLVNVEIASTAVAYVGGLTGFMSGASEIRRAYVTGRVAAPADGYVGGIAGVATGTLTDSWSAASVSGGVIAGGAIGYAAGGTIRRVYAAGPVSCPMDCHAGGLIGGSVGATVALSSASGPVIGGDPSYTGGLVGTAINSTIQRSYALGTVTIGVNGQAGGLIGHLDGGMVTEVYAVGPVAGGAGATLGGLVGAVENAPTVTSAFWDTVTSKQMASAAGTGYTTGQLRIGLPPGFSNAWALTRKRSYPFIEDADIAFTAPLAPLVKSRKVYTFLPIDQHEASQYAGAATGANIASLATVYTMIARAIGITRNVAKLKEVKIDKYFWDDATRTTTWQGPVTTRATLGTFAAIAANAALNDSNVIGAMKTSQLVLLRGTYTKANGNSAKHWLLGTLYTTFGNAVGAVIANDPWTGDQVMIDPATRKVVSPANYPLANFRIDGYQPVTLN
jgi:hypothetical protein